MPDFCGQGLSHATTIAMAKSEEKKSKKRKETETVDGDVSMAAEEVVEDRVSFSSRNLSDAANTLCS